MANEKFTLVVKKYEKGNFNHLKVILELDKITELICPWFLTFLFLFLYLTSIKSVFQFSKLSSIAIEKTYFQIIHVSFMNNFKMVT